MNFKEVADFKENKVPPGSAGLYRHSELITGIRLKNHGKSILGTSDFTMETQPPADMAMSVHTIIGFEV